MPLAPSLPAALPAFKHLSDEQRVLTQLVSQNPSVLSRIRQRASILLLLDQGLPIPSITSQVSTHPSSVRNLVSRYLQGGLCAALLGVRASAARRRWLALSPFHPLPARRA